MKKLIVLLALLALPAFADDTESFFRPPKAWFSDPTFEPYGTVAWRSLDGKAILGAGANVAFHVGSGFAIWGFGESDNAAHSTIDRAGIGLRYEGNLGSYIHGDGGIAYGYDIEGTSNYSQTQSSFIRLPVGLTFDLIKTKHVEGGIRAAYAFDISGDGKFGSAFGRAFIGPQLNIKW